MTVNYPINNYNYNNIKYKISYEYFNIKLHKASILP